MRRHTKALAQWEREQLREYARVLGHRGAVIVNARRSAAEKSRIGRIAANARWSQKKAEAAVDSRG